MFHRMVLASVLVGAMAAAATAQRVTAPLAVADRDAAWLGVQLMPVPRPLAVHLDLRGAGVMVGNIFKQSPADKAGVERYDVIVEADGQEVRKGVEGFSHYVRGKKPGDALELVFYRKAKKQTVTLELGGMPADPQKMELRYEDEPGVFEPGVFGLRGKILRPGPHGWELDDLGELPPLEGLKKRWLERDAGASKEGETRPSDKDLDNAHRELRRKQEDALRNQNEAVKKYQEALQEYLKRYAGPTWDGQNPAPDVKKWRDWAEHFVPKSTPAEPVTRFEVGPDGAITAEVHDGPTQLVLHFPSEKEFQAQAPQLFEHYRATREKLR